jgi:hypothetical protein
MSDARSVRAEYCRRRAEEIRRFAQQSRFPEIREELFALAERFDRMAVAVESRIALCGKSRLG